MTLPYSDTDTLDIINCCQARISAIQAFCISVSELTCHRDPDPRRWGAAWRVVSAAELELGDLESDMDELARRWLAPEAGQRKRQGLIPRARPCRARMRQAGANPGAPFGPLAFSDHVVMACVSGPMNTNIL